MPCYDNRRELDHAIDRRELNNQREANAYLEALCCGVILALNESNEDFDGFDWTDLVDWQQVGFPKEVALQWWAQHQANDATK